jgi:hypothetical protein
LLSMVRPQDMKIHLILHISTAHRSFIHTWFYYAFIILSIIVLYKYWEIWESRFFCIINLYKVE